MKHDKWTPVLPRVEGRFLVHDTMLGLTFIIEIQHREHGMMFKPQVLHLERWYSLIAAPTWWEYKVVSHAEPQVFQIPIPFGGEQEPGD